MTLSLSRATPLFLLIAAWLSPTVARAELWVVCTQDTDRWVCGEADLAQMPLLGTAPCPGDQFSDVNSDTCIDVPCSCGPIGDPPVCNECLCGGTPTAQLATGVSYYIWRCMDNLPDGGTPRGDGGAPLDAAVPLDGAVPPPDSSITQQDATVASDAAHGVSNLVYRGGGCSCRAAPTMASAWLLPLVGLIALRLRRRP